MRYLIDGYNLLHAVWPGEARHVRARAWSRFRQRLLDRLRVTATDPQAITVVFDSHQSPSDATAEEVFHGIHVRFAAGYPSADDLIEELIRTDSAPTRLTVVSNDHRVRDAARRRGCSVVTCLDFFDVVKRPPVPPRNADETPAKPDHVSSQEVERWLAEFGESGEAP